MYKLLIFENYDEGFSESKQSVPEYSDNMEEDEEDEEQEFNLRVLAKNLETFFQCQIGNHLQIKVRFLFRVKVH